jgi:hypothetical protein
VLQEEEPRLRRVHGHQRVRPPCKPWVSVEGERHHPTGRERMGSPTLQTLQDPILLLSWVCYLVAAYQQASGPDVN